MLSVPIGTIIDGYRVLAPRRAFSFNAAVYCAEPLAVGPPVAIIFLRERISERHPAFSAFEQEGRALSRFTHPGVVEVFDFGLHKQIPYVVTALPAGELLPGDVDAIRAKPERAVRAIAALHDAIEAIDGAGLVHGALRRESLMIAPDGRLIIWDLAIVRLERAINGARTADSASDVAFVTGLARSLIGGQEAPTAIAAAAPTIEVARPLLPAQTVEVRRPVQTAKPVQAARVQPPPPPAAPKPTARQTMKAIAAAQVARPTQFAQLSAPIARRRAPIEDDEPSFVGRLEPGYVTWFRGAFSRHGSPSAATFDSASAMRRSINLMLTCGVALLVLVMLLR